MLTRQSWIALGVALVLGLVAVYIANVYLNGKQNQAALGGTTKIAVAAVPMDYGNDITPDKVRYVDFPNRSIPAGSFTTAAQLLPAGQQALRADADRRQRADPHNQDFRRRPGRLDRVAAARRACAPRPSASTTCRASPASSSRTTASTC